MKANASTFRIGVIGCGRIANAHVQALLALRAAELVALVDPVEERAITLAEKYGIRAKVYTSLGDAVSHLDGAVIAAPNHLHADLAVQCVNAGVAVLIEKPLAVSLAEGKRICDAADAAGVTVAVGYVTRFSESNQLMRELLWSDGFGRVRRFVYQFGTKGGWAPLSAYNLDVKTAGGGVLVVTGTHFLDRMIDWFGYPVGARLRDDSHGGPEANAIATFEFDHPAGVIAGAARFSKTVTLEGGIVLDTEAGTVILRDRPGASIVVRSEKTPHLETELRARARAPKNAPPADFVLQLEDFIAAARSRTRPMVSGHSALASLRLIEELYGHRQPLADEWYPTLAAVEVGS